MMMNNTRVIYLALVSLILSACNGFEQTSTGVKYKIISDANSPAASAGEVLKMQVKQIYGDSVLRDSRKFIPEYHVMDTSVVSKDAFEIFSQARVGDSLVFVVEPDSVVQKKFPKIKAKELMTTVKIITILANQDSARNDAERERKRLINAPINF